MESKTEMIKNNFSRPGMRLGYFAAYYKNDKPKGIGIKIEDQKTVETISNNVIEIMIELEEKWQHYSEDQKKQMITEMFQQLDLWGREQTPLNQIGVPAIANILFLNFHQ